MQQQAVNTFNEGINFDLNPITTPNNVLTDCINGSFITFNGDELALQNDAGNTKIETSPGSGLYVTLSPGFYPLGIKEYGGVLYIISGNTTTNEVEFGSYPSPEAAASTNYTGNEVQYIPATVSDAAIPALYKYSTLNPVDPVTKETIEFKSGRYIKFANTLVSSDVNVSDYKWDVGTSKALYQPRFYKIKLYHQLSNGYIDLTTDIWSKFITEKTTLINSNAWYKDGSFFYYCPSRFKGKLALSLEIEDLYKFELFGIVDINLITGSPNKYELVLKVKALPYNYLDIINNNINITTSSIYIPKIKVELNIASKNYKYVEIITNNKSIPKSSLYSTSATYSINDYVHIVSGQELFYYKNKTGVNSTVTNTTNWDPLIIEDFTFTISNLPEDYKNEIVNYRITPVLGNDIEEYGEYVDINSNVRVLPKEFIDKYTINGTRLITTAFDDVTFQPIDGNSSCDNDTHLRTYKEFALVDTNGNYLNLTLQPVLTPYIFLKQGSTSFFSLPPQNGTLGVDYFLINEYTIEENSLYPTIVPPANTTIASEVLAMFATTPAIVTDATCTEAPTGYVNLQLEFNYLSPQATIVVQQAGYPNQNWTGYVGNTVVLTVASGVQAITTITLDGFEPVTIIGTYISPTSVNVAMVAMVTYDSNGTVYGLKWSTTDMPLPSIGLVSYDIIGNVITVNNEQLAKIDNFLYQTTYYDIITYGTFVQAEINQTGPLTLTYVNIVNNTDFIIKNGVIFRKIIN